MKKILVILSAFFCIFLFPTTAQAQIPARIECGNTAEIKSKLNDLGEVVVVTGITKAGNTIEYYLNEATKEWTLLITFTRPVTGQSCIPSYGSQGVLLPNNRI